MAPTDDPHRDQAEALCSELNLQLMALDDKTAKLKAQMAKYVAENRRGQIARLQNQWRDTVVERRKLIDMLIELGHNHPCDHGSTQLSGPADEQ